MRAQNRGMLTKQSHPKFAGGLRIHSNATRRGALQRYQTAELTNERLCGSDLVNMDAPNSNVPTPHEQSTQNSPTSLPAKLQDPSKSPSPASDNRQRNSEADSGRGGRRNKRKDLGRKAWRYSSHAITPPKASAAN